MSERKRVLKLNFGSFGSFPAMEKRPKMKKTLYIARFFEGFWMPEH